MKNLDDTMKAQKLPDFLRDICVGISPEWIVKIREAYRISIEAHAGQLRKSGEPYILHIEGATETAHGLVQKIDKRLSPEDVIVALLHDTLEDHPEYFDEILEKFGYDIIYRILCITKPNKKLLEKWDGAAPDDKKYELGTDPIYILWNEGLKNDDFPVKENTTQSVFPVTGIIFRGVIGNKDQNAIADNGGRLLFGVAKTITNIYFDALREIDSMDIDDEEKGKKIEKKWTEFLYLLQLLLISESNMPIKIGDKMHNLGDTRYLSTDIPMSPAERRLRVRKLKSILSTVEVYKFLLTWHDKGAWTPDFEIAVVQSKTALSLLNES